MALSSLSFPPAPCPSPSHNFATLPLLHFSTNPSTTARPSTYEERAIYFMTDEMIRLSKLMTEQGLCSRREADSYIEKGWVLVNGNVIDRLGTRVSPNAEISLLPAAKKKQESKVTILLHKPLGIISAQAKDGYTLAIALITPENQDPDFPGSNLVLCQS
jgi:23S rRNA pseudouridine2604 synthase